MPCRPVLYEFVEAPAFARHRDSYLDEEEFQQLQQFMAENPAAGDVIPGTGGLRKLRWAQAGRGKGKRGGLRVIYYTFLPGEQIWLMTLYGKDEMSDLTVREKQQLRQAILAEKQARQRKLGGSR